MTAVQFPHFTNAIDQQTSSFNKAWQRFFDAIWRRTGGLKPHGLGGTLNANTTSIGNVGAGEDDLITYTLPANMLSDAKDIIQIDAFGSFAANANNKRVKLFLGSTTIFDTTTIAANGSAWHIRAIITRTGSATQTIVSTFAGDTTLVTTTSTYTAGAEDLTTPLIIKCTGEGVADNDIVQQSLLIQLYPTNN